MRRCVTHEHRLADAGTSDEQPEAVTHPTIEHSVELRNAERQTVEFRQRLDALERAEPEAMADRRIALAQPLMLLDTAHHVTHVRLGTLRGLVHDLEGQCLN